MEVGGASEAGDMIFQREMELSSVTPKSRTDDRKVK